MERYHYLVQKQYLSNALIIHHPTDQIPHHIVTHPIQLVKFLQIYSIKFYWYESISFLSGYSEVFECRHRNTMWFVVLAVLDNSTYSTLLHSSSIVNTLPMQCMNEAWFGNFCSSFLQTVILLFR